MVLWAKQLLLICFVGLAPSRSTTIPVASQSQLNSAISNNATLNFSNSIALSDEVHQNSGVFVSNIANLKIFGNDFEVNGKQLMRCFWIESSVVTFQFLIVTNCQAITSSFAGAILLSSSSLLNMVGCTLSENLDSDVTEDDQPYDHNGGGAILVADSSVLQMLSCDVSNNLAASGKGGAISFVSSSRGYLTNSSFISNTAAGYGGAIYSVDSTLEVMTTILTTNHASTICDEATPGYGGGAYFYSSTATFTASTLSWNIGNTATTSTYSNICSYQRGGGISSELSDIKMHSCDLSNNRAYYGHGGAFDLRAGNASFYSCEITSNSVGSLSSTNPGAGGGISATTENIRLEIYSTNLIDNSGCFGGGGIYFTALSGDYTDHLIIISNAKFSGNTGYDGNDIFLGEYNSEPGILELECIAGCDQAGTYQISSCSESSATQCEIQYPGASAIQPCSCATFCTSAASSCTACPMNTYNPVASDNSECEQCPYGKVIADNGVDPMKHIGIYQCVYCDAGQQLGNDGRCEACPAGRYKFEADGGNCTLCPAGQYQSDKGSVSCNPCQSGLLSDPSRLYCYFCQPGQYVLNESSCVSCPMGTYAPVALSGSCKNCSAGYSTLGATQGAVNCAACSAGKFSAAFSVVCEDCTAGTYSGTAAKVCSNCTAGSSTLGVNTSATICAPCSAGSFSQSNAVVCSKCPSGKYSNSKATICSDCDIGYFATEIGSASCLPCSSGTFAKEKASVICEDCTAGTYSGTAAKVCSNCTAGSSTLGVNTSATICAPCSAGSFSQSNAVVCSKCPSGKYSNSKATVCSDCDIGYFATETGSASCLPCSSGTYAKEKASVICEDCAKGKFQSSSAQGNCLECPEGTYNAETGKSYCSSCSNSPPLFSAQQTSYPGSSKCEACVGSLTLPPGYYFNNGTHQCHKCEDGMDCEEDFQELHTLTIKENWYRFSLESTSVYPCPYMGACRGGSGVIAFHSCTSNYKGPLCSTCADGAGFSELSSSCENCDQDLYFVTLGLFLLVLLVIGLTVYCLRMRFKKKISEFLKWQKDNVLIVNLRIAQVTVFFVTVQTGIMINDNQESAGGKPPPKSFSRFQDIFSFLNLKFSILPLGCFEFGDAFDVLLLQTLSTILICLFFFVMWFRQRLVSDGKNYFATFGVLFMKFVLPSVTLTVCRAFRCKRYDYGDGQKHEYLLEDLSIDCGSRYYQNMKVYAIVMILILPVGCTLLALVSLFRLRQRGEIESAMTEVLLSNELRTNSESLEKNSIISETFSDRGEEDDISLTNHDDFNSSSTEHRFEDEEEHQVVSNSHDNETVFSQEVIEGHDICSDSATLGTLPLAKDNFQSQSPFFTLFCNVRLKYWYVEVLDMVRRLLLTCFPVVFTNYAAVIVFSLSISFIALVFQQETLPYLLPPMNKIKTMEQYQNVFFVVVMLIQDSDMFIKNGAMYEVAGIALISTNLAMFLLMFGGKPSRNVLFEEEKNMLKGFSFSKRDGRSSVSFLEDQNESKRIFGQESVESGGIRENTMYSPLLPEVTVDAKG